MAQSEKEKMLSGELYRPTDPHIQVDLAATSVWLARYNAAADAAGERHRLLMDGLGEVGKGAVIRPTFFATTVSTFGLSQMCFSTSTA